MRFLSSCYARHERTARKYCFNVDLLIVQSQKNYVLEGLSASFIVGNRKYVTSEANFGLELALCGNVNVSPGASSTPTPACGLGELSSFPLTSHFVFLFNKVLFIWITQQIFFTFGTQDQLLRPPPPSVRMDISFTRTI